MYIYIHINKNIYIERERERRDIYMYPPSLGERLVVVLRREERRLGPSNGRKP